MPYRLATPQCNVASCPAKLAGLMLLTRRLTFLPYRFTATLTTGVDEGNRSEVFLFGALRHQMELLYGIEP